MAFAYVTNSGLREFELRIGNVFWSNVRSKWLAGIDYGRSEPQALADIHKKKTARVRLADGAWVVQRAGFRPRQDFHMKACFLSNPQQHRYAMIAGSGNFSRNGLVASTECGIVVEATTEQEYKDLIEPVFKEVRAVWKAAGRFANVHPQYDALWTPGNAGPAAAAPNVVPTARKRFWVQAGYVTKNRNPRPGNQIDLPRGAHLFFGLPPAPAPALNAKLGDVTYIEPGRAPLTRALRFGGNGMEKITLPVPEGYPFGTYEGKIIEFTRVIGGFAVDAYELLDFRQLLQQSPNAIELKIPSGRRYGYR